MTVYLFSSATLTKVADRLLDAWVAMQAVGRTEIEICNLALSHIGETARVTSIDPPDGSAQAEACARFYSISRDTLLERHAWDFTTRFANLTPKPNDRTDWAYAYEWPATATGILELVPARAGREQPNYGPHGFAALYAVEMNHQGERTIYTDVPDASIRFSVWVTDSSKFSALFIQALSYQLASALAGVIIKGKEGSQIADVLMQRARGYEASAMAQDSSKRRRAEPNNRFPWRR